MQPHAAPLGRAVTLHSHRGDPGERDAAVIEQRFRCERSIFVERLNELGG
jgi:hypothetical protein